MINKKISTMFLVVLLAAFSVEAWPGPLVWGPQIYIRTTGPPVPITDTFTIEKPKGKFWLQVGNGGHIKRPDIKRGAVEPVNQATSAYIKLNGVQVVGPDDLNQNIYGFTKDITLQVKNTIEVEVRGKPESYITLEIIKYTIATLNMNVDNAKGDLTGNNMKDQIVLWWSGEENASEYVIYKAYSIDGSWTEWERGYAGEPMNEVDITSEAETRDLCYKIEALDSRGKVIRRYDSVCVPKWQTEESALPLTMEDLSNTGVEPAIAGSTQTSSLPYNDMCLSDNDFTNTSTMSYEDIKKFLKDNKSFLQEDKVEDVDKAFFDPTEFIDFAAQTYGINPQVILTTLQKEQGAIEAKTRLEDWKLKLIMGYDKPSTIMDQIVDATAQMRRDFDRLSNGQPTAGGWQKGVTKNSLDLLPVTPANKAVAVLFSYTPWVGKGWGGRKGGNALFCQVWKEFGFFKPVECGASKIGYTTQQMSINQMQTLTLTNPTPGAAYAWNVASGGGSISPIAGTWVTYTAPASNPDCDLNPTIQVSTGGVVCDTLKIAINAYTLGVAYWVNECKQEGYCTGLAYGNKDCNTALVVVQAYKCDGSYARPISGCANGNSNCQLAGFPVPLGCSCDQCYSREFPPVGACTGIHRTFGDMKTCASLSQVCCGAVMHPFPLDTPDDKRTGAMKAGGCCPAALLPK